MSYDITWYVPNQVIYSQIAAELTLSDSQSIVGDLGQLLENSTSGQVHILGNLIGLSEDNMTFRILSSVVTSLSLYRNVGWIIVIGEAEQLSQLGNAITTQFFGMRYRTFETLTEACTFLKSEDPSLDFPQINNM